MRIRKPIPLLSFDEKQFLKDIRAEIRSRDNVVPWVKPWYDGVEDDYKDLVYREITHYIDESPRVIENTPESRKADRLFRNCNPHVKWFRSKARSRSSYDNVADIMFLPVKPLFANAHEYYHCRFHELIHWTSYKNRINRDVGWHPRSKERAFEEITAEIGALILMRITGLSDRDTSIRQPVNYIRSWNCVAGRREHSDRTVGEVWHNVMEALDLILWHSVMGLNDIGVKT